VRRIESGSLRELCRTPQRLHAPVHRGLLVGGLLSPLHSGQVEEAHAGRARVHCPLQINEHSDLSKHEENNGRLADDGKGSYSRQTRQKRPATLGCPVCMMTSTLSRCTDCINSTYLLEGRDLVVVHQVHGGVQDEQHGCEPGQVGEAVGEGEEVHVEEVEVCREQLGEVADAGLAAEAAGR
jgi:hypothetical protein